MCHLEEKLTSDGLMPYLYERYVEDTLARMPSTDAAAVFRTTLNGLHPGPTFRMELSVDNEIPFIGIEIVKNGKKLITLLHFHNPTDKRHKDSLLTTMIHRSLSSTTEAYNTEYT